MINTQVQTAFNQQINAETYSAYLYLAMAAWLEKQRLAGFAHWMVIQSQEELSHAMLLYRYVIDNGGTVHLDAIAAPPASWETPLACMQAVLQHEQLVTGLINSMVVTSRRHNDKNAEKFLQWFVDEQVEEEENAGALVAGMAEAQNSRIAMRILDERMGRRVFSMPRILHL